MISSALLPEKERSDWGDYRPLIIFVDDKVGYYDIMIELVEGAGYRMLMAYDGPSALAMMRQHRPDLAVLDILMPGMDGYELCGHMRQDPVLARIPVIFVTVLNCWPQQKPGFDLGAEDVVDKPFVCDRLLSKIKVVLRHKGCGSRPWPNRLTLEPEGDLCWVPGRTAPIVLTEYEYCVLAYLLPRAGQLVTRKALLVEALQHHPVTHPSASILRNIIAELRRKLGTAPGGQPYITNWHGKGYMLALSCAPVQTQA